MGNEPLLRKRRLIPPTTQTGRWADIDLEAIRGNLRQIGVRQPVGTRIVAVVKANAYGHGAQPVARAALDAGAWGLAVSTLDEADELVRANIGNGARTLVLGGLLPDDAYRAAELGCAVMCHRIDLARALDGAATATGRRLHVHLEVDTGLGRLGATPEEALDLARFIADAPGLQLAGTFTQFSSAESDPALTQQQAGRFRRVLDAMVAARIDPGLRHASNSGGALRHPDLAFDAVRIGIALYGYSPAGDEETEGLQPALSLRARVTHVKEVTDGSTIGYGAAWRAKRNSVIATASIGYADGVQRARSSSGEVLLRGRRAPIVGRLNMDAITLDATDVPDVSPGDIATLIGADGAGRITGAQVAKWGDTSIYRVLTAIGPRVERRYSN